MKIAVIGSKGLPPRQGGIEHHCAAIYSRIAAEGHYVEVFSRSSYNQMPWNAHYYYNDVRVTNLPSINFRGVDALINSGLAATVASLKKFDIIHFHALGPSLFSGLPRLLSRSSKVVVTCHGLDWQRAKWGKFSTRLLKLGESVAVHNAHEIGVVSEELRNYFWYRHGRQTTYIRNAPADYRASDPTFAFGREQGFTPKRYVLFLGRLVPEKRPDLLIQVFKKLSPPDWKLLLVGNASHTNGYVNQLRALADGNPDIHFVGELIGKRLAEIVRGAGLFVLPSTIEGLPLALLEAMKENIPVIASSIPVHQEIVGIERGLLFEEGDFDALFTALDWAIKNPDSMAQKTFKAQQYIQYHHNWDYIARDWLSLYKSLLSTSAPVATPV